MREYFLTRGYQVVGERVRTPFSEVDLIVKNEREILLLEVKSLSHADWLEHRVGFRQKLRLQRALGYIQARYSLPVLFHLVTVTKDEEITVYTDFLG